MDKFKFIVREINLMYVDRREIVICIKQSDTNISVPHPITKFITDKYGNKKYSVNTQRIVANTICQFLNFLLDKVKRDNDYVSLKFKGLNNLTIDHGKHFIQSKKEKKLSPEYINKTVYYLSVFYSYLNDYQIIDINHRLEKISILDHEANIFDEYGKRREAKQTKHKLKDFGSNKNYLIPLFISISQKVAPEVTLGICLQFFGGLRKGEVVNVMKNDIQVSESKTFQVFITDNTHILFKDKTDLKDESVKRVNYLQRNLRKQELLYYDLISEIYISHLKYIRKYKISETGVLFINNDGKPMSGQVYKNRFEKVKKHFLKELLKRGNYEDYNLLSDTSWSTHIGRGIFTNLLIDMGLSETQVAIMRGDRSTSSSKHYYDSITGQRLIKENLPKLKAFLENNIKEGF